MIKVIAVVLTYEDGRDRASIMRTQHCRIKKSSTITWTFQPLLQLCWTPLQCLLLNYQSQWPPLSSHTCPPAPCSPSYGSISLQMTQFLQHNIIMMFCLTVSSICSVSYRCVCTWEVFERQVRIVEVTRAADDCIKDVTLLISIFSLHHHLPLTGAREVWSLGNSPHQSLGSKTSQTIHPKQWLFNYIWSVVTWKRMRCSSLKCSAYILKYFRILEWCM